jgi:type I restriction enzyme S subunit
VIEKTQAAIAKYKAIKQGMLHDLFTRGIDPATGKLRPTYESAPELYKESKLGWIPKEWEDCKMGKHILENLYGPRFNARDYAENGNVKTIRGTDFTKEGEILYEQTPKALLPNGLIKIHKLRDGDVVIVTTADCGLAAIFKKPINDVDFIPSAYSVKYRFAKNINPHFIKYFMATDSAIRQVNKFVRQGTLGNLPGSDVLRFEMIYPDSDEQFEIANRLKTIDNKIQTEQTYLHKLQQIKAGLMVDLLSGKKKVNVDEEPAH